MHRPENEYLNRDDQINDAVKSALSRELHDSSIGVNVSVREGVVSLWGMVDVLAEKEAAEIIVKRIPDVEGVENGLTVAMDNFISDKDINELVLDRLSHSPNPAVRKIGCETRDGIVYLVGRVTAMGDSHDAEKIAAGVRGVKEVKSQLTLAEESQRDDATITNAVERAFANSDRVNERLITTSTQRGVVKLQGMVDTLEDIEKAVEIAYSIPGVKAVHSDIRYRHGATHGDRAMTNQLRQMLSREEDLSRGTIKAHVVNGMAFLSGEVFDIDAKRRAEEVTRQLEGLTGISNTIQVSAHQLS